MLQPRQIKSAPAFSPRVVAPQYFASAMFTHISTQARSWKYKFMYDCRKKLWRLVFKLQTPDELVSNSLCLAPEVAFKQTVCETERNRAPLKDILLYDVIARPDHSDSETILLHKKHSNCVWSNQVDQSSAYMLNIKNWWGKDKVRIKY